MTDSHADIQAIKQVASDLANDLNEVKTDLADLNAKAKAGSPFSAEDVQTLSDSVAGLQAIHQGLRAAIGGGGTAPAPAPAGGQTP